MKYVFAVHEVSHGIIAILRGYQLDRVSLNGPPDNPGKTDRTIPDGHDGNDPVWARKELALFAAGYVGEEVVFGEHQPKHIHGHPESDYPMMLQCALTCVDNQDDCDIVAAYRDPAKKFKFPRHLWRENVAIDWAPYDKLIYEVQEEVRTDLSNYSLITPHLAKWLLQRGVVSGREFNSEFDRLANTNLTSIRELQEAQRLAFNFALGRGNGLLPEYDRGDATDDFLRAAGEVMARRSPE